MANKSTAIDLSVAIDASPETVWRILTDPERLSAWMEGEVTFEARTGSPFRAAFPNYRIVLAGEVVTLDVQARRLGVTWGVESGEGEDKMPAGSTLVEFLVRPDGAGCWVDLRHSGLSSGEEVHQQEGGWRFQLSKLDLKANRIDLAAGLERTLPDWIAAWNEQDAEARLAALHRCCAEDVTFRDDWTGLTGIGLLSMHIANCHMYMPGYSLEHTGDVRICRGEALVGWRTSGPGGPMKGFNHIRADPDGTIRRVTGFTAA
ncbi:MAG: SRPBCC domain-containing protein [Gemmatimonadetes bacterium]|nr:SRPBCC domain-containing protein [Gemmatimonadota bacterium]